MHHRAPILLIAVFISFCFSAINPQNASAEDKPALSEEIRTVIEREGVDAAKAQFTEIYPANKDQYEIDTESLTTLAYTYMQTGEMEKGMAVMEMVSAVAMGMASAYSSQAREYSPEVADMMSQQEQAQQQYEKQQQAVRQEDQQKIEKTLAQQRGRSRDDLERFAGIYGDPEKPDSNRSLWVMVSCDGYLVSGATWGDASAWWMRSAADKVFTYQDDWQSLSLEFIVEDGETASGMNHDLDFITSPLARQSPVPDDWGECLERPRR